MNSRYIYNNEYYLETRYDSRQSFYYKAEVKENNNFIDLYSYNTHVCEIDRNTNEANILDFYSNTTQRHIKEFLKQHGFYAGNKQEMYYQYTKEGKEELEEIEQKRKEKEEKRIASKIAKEKKQRELKAKKEERLQKQFEKMKKSLIKELGDTLSIEEIINFAKSEVYN